jgi:hypothetical protein
MKTPKPGQYTWINGVQYRAKRRICGCNGCALDDFFRCPNIVDCRNGKKPLECYDNDIILVRV